MYVFQDSLASSILSLRKKNKKTKNTQPLQAAVFVCTLPDLNPATSSIGPDLIDWLLVLLFVPIDSFISSICSIILSTPGPSQNSVNGCCTVHRCPWSGCFAENHPIWFGRELDPLLSLPLLSTPRLLALPFLASPLLLSSPVLSLTPHWLLSSWAKWLPRRLLRRWRSLALPFLAVMGTLPLWLSFLQGSSKKAPPAAQLMRVKQPGSHSAVKREKRFSTSSFLLSANRELQKLRALAGTLPLEKRSNQSFLWMLHFPRTLAHPPAKCKITSI